MKMGKISPPPKLNMKNFYKMQFDTNARRPLMPVNLEKPFFIERSALARGNQPFA